MVTLAVIAGVVWLLGVWLLWNMIRRAEGSTWRVYVMIAAWPITCAWLATSRNY